MVEKNRTYNSRGNGIFQQGMGEVRIANEVIQEWKILLTVKIHPKPYSIVI